MYIDDIISLSLRRMRSVSDKYVEKIKTYFKFIRVYFHKSRRLWYILFVFFFFFQELNFLVESFGLLNDLFPLPSILDAGYPVFDLHLADVLCDIILPSVLGSSLWSFG